MEEDLPPPERPPWMPSVDRMILPNGIDQKLVGRTILIGITKLASDGTTIKSQGQYHGEVVRADRSSEIVIECESVWSGKTITLSPQIGPFTPPIRVNIGCGRPARPSRIRTCSQPGQLSTRKILMAACSDRSLL